MDFHKYSFQKLAFILKRLQYKWDVPKLEPSRNVTSKVIYDQNPQNNMTASFFFASTAHATQWSNYLNQRAEILTRRSNWRPQRAKNSVYLFKIFPRFWLVKTTRILHYNQLLAVDQMLNQWHQNCSPLHADYWTVQRENLWTWLCYFWWAEKQRVTWRTGKYFEQYLSNYWIRLS